tara:strand:+ start:30915 stop:31433 length:519 start_codon:yes stop_codon:yes gene_type:complete
MDKLKKHISEIKDFPKQGISFLDLNPIYREPNIWNQSMISLESFIINIEPDYIAGIESRGFIIGSALSYKLNKGFIPIRKPNKLPGKLIGLNYQLEYGEDRLEIQTDISYKNKNILVIDDLLATGGTAEAAGNLIQNAGGKLIGYAFLVELTKLKGRNKLCKKLMIESAIKY